MTKARVTGIIRIVFIAWLIVTAFALWQLRVMSQWRPPAGMIHAARGPHTKEGSIVERVRSFYSAGRHSASLIIVFAAGVSLSAQQAAADTELGWQQQLNFRVTGGS